MWELFPDVEGSNFHHEAQRAFDEQIKIVFENYYPPFDRWFENRIYPTGGGLSIFTTEITNRKRAEAILSERLRLESLNGEIGQALVKDGNLQNLLSRCVEILVSQLGVAFARIWTFNKNENVLELQASAGMYTHLDGKHSRIPIGRFKIGLIAEERMPHMTNEVLSDARVSDKEWAKREGMKSFAGYPLIVEEQLVGVMCVFSRQSLSHLTLEAIATVSNGISNTIERKQSEILLRESEQKFATMAEAVPQLTWMAEPDGFIFWYNRRWYEYTGTTPEEMTGWGWQSVHDAEMLPAVLGRWQASIQKGEPFEMEFPLRRGVDGALRWFLTRIVPLHDTNGRIVRWFGTNTDIEELRQARLQAEQANRLKDEFLATLSHELRTPLNAILGWSQILQNKNLGASEMEKALATIERNTRSQSQLIDDILDVSRIITGKLRMDVRAVDLSQVITAAIDAARPSAEAKSIPTDMPINC